MGGPRHWCTRRKLAATSDFFEGYVALPRASRDLTALSDHPDAWSLEAASPNEADDEHESEEDEEGSQPATPKLKPSPSRPLVSNAYNEFRQFLELGCMNSPTQGYPAVLIILSTIPPSVRTPLSQVAFEASD